MNISTETLQRRIANGDEKAVKVKLSMKISKSNVAREIKSCGTRAIIVLLFMSNLVITIRYIKMYQNSQLLEANRSRLNRTFAQRIAHLKQVIIDRKNEVDDPRFKDLQVQYTCENVYELCQQNRV